MIKLVHKGLFVLLVLLFSASVFGQQQLGITFDKLEASLIENKKEYQVKTEYGLTYISEREWVSSAKEKLNYGCMYFFDENKECYKEIIFYYSLFMRDMTVAASLLEYEDTDYIYENRPVFRYKGAKYKPHFMTYVEDATKKDKLTQSFFVNADFFDKK